MKTQNSSAASALLYQQPEIVNVVNENGLRYKSKAPGSIFGPTSMCSTMSCIKCGRHRPRVYLKTRRIGSNNFLACDPSCETVQQQIETKNLK